MLDRVRERIHPQELIELRAAAETKPVTSHRAPSWPRRTDADETISFADIKAMSDPDWIGRSQNGGFALDAELLETLELTDWQARIAADFGAVESALVLLAANTAAQIERAAYAEYFAANGLHLACVTAKAKVSDLRAELATLAPLAAKAGC